MMESGIQNMVVQIRIGSIFRYVNGSAIQFCPHAFDIITIQFVDYYNQIKCLQYLYSNPNKGLQRINQQTKQQLINPKTEYYIWQNKYSMVCDSMHHPIIIMLRLPEDPLLVNHNILSLIITFYLLVTWQMDEQDILTPVELNCLKALEDIDDKSLIHKSSILQQTLKQNKQDTFDLLFNLHPHQDLLEAKTKLQHLRQESQKLTQLESHLVQFQNNFKHLIESKNSLQQSIKIIQGDSGHILEKQNKMVALSLEMQQILNHYNYITKFKFDDVMETYNDAASLQLKLSELTEGVEFFASHQTFTNSKKYLQKYRDQKKKMLAFVRGYLLKLFTKQDSFVMKNSKTVHLQHYFNNGCYPKATFKFLTDYLTIFPQFKNQLYDVYQNSKDQQQSIPAQILKKQQQIQQFLLDPATKSLVSYIQRNQPQIHSESIVKLFTFYRVNLHQQLIQQFQLKKQPLQNIFEVLQYLIYIIPSQTTYMCYCLSLDRATSIDVVKSVITTIINQYSGLIRPSLKQIKSWRQIFKAFQKINQLLVAAGQIIDNYIYKMEYKVYPLGRVMNLTTLKTETIVEFIKGVFIDIFAVLQQSLEFCLPKDFNIPKVSCPQPSIQQLIQILPNLKYCPKICSRYVVQSLDNILRAISNASNQLETRYQSFFWNITSIHGLQTALANARLSKPLLKTQMSLNLGSTVSVLNTVGQIENKGNIWNYAKQVFSLLSTGLPVLNELTIDFNQHLKSHMQKLQSQFIKDLTFIYGKSMIQFLQKLHNHQQQQSSALLSVDSLKQEYERLVLGIDEFVLQSIKQFQTYKKGYIIDGVEYGPKLIVLLMEQVLQNLLELLSDFYIATSKTVNVEMVRQLEFKDIKQVKNRVVQRLKNK